MKKKMILINLIFIIFIALLSGTVNAATTGTIDFKAINNSSGTVVENLQVSIYQVKKQDNEGVMQFVNGFESCTIDTNNLSQDNIDNLKIYAKSNAQPLFVKTTDSNGNFNLTNLDLGIYLLVQENNTDEITMQTMVITIPELTVENGLKYEVIAKPKIVNTEKTIVKEEIKDKVLPYTGTLDWLVPTLSIIGIIIFAIAWLKVYSTSKKKVN